MADACKPPRNHRVTKRCGTKTAKPPPHLQVVDIYDPKEPWASYIANALKAKECYEREKSYLVHHEITRDHGLTNSVFRRSYTYDGGDFSDLGARGPRSDRRRVLGPRARRAEVGRRAAPGGGGQGGCVDPAGDRSGRPDYVTSAEDPSLIVSQSLHTHSARLTCYQYSGVYLLDAGGLTAGAHSPAGTTLSSAGSPSSPPCRAPPSPQQTNSPLCTASPQTARPSLTPTLMPCLMPRTHDSKVLLASTGCGPDLSLSYP